MPSDAPSAPTPAPSEDEPAVAADAVAAADAPSAVEPLPVAVAPAAPAPAAPALPVAVAHAPAVEPALLITSSAAPTEPVSRSKEWAAAIVLMILFALISAAFMSVFRG